MLTSFALRVLFLFTGATIYFATFFGPGLEYSSNGYAPRGMMIFYWVALVIVVITLELLITISERIQRKKITNEMHMQGLKGEPSMEGTGFISAPLVSGHLF